MVSSLYPTPLLFEKEHSWHLILRDKEAGGCPEQAYQPAVCQQIMCLEVGFLILLISLVPSKKGAGWDKSALVGPGLWSLRRRGHFENIGFSPLLGRVFLVFFCWVLLTVVTLWRILSCGFGASSLKPELLPLPLLNALKYATGALEGGRAGCDVPISSGYV